MSLATYSLKLEGWHPLMNNTKKVIDFLAQANYNFNRRSGETPERLKLVFKDTNHLEKIMQNQLDIAQADYCQAVKAGDKKEACKLAEQIEYLKQAVKDENC